MKVYSLIIIFICPYVDTLQKILCLNSKEIFLNFGYGINFKYKWMLSHLFDRFYVVTKFILPTIIDLRFLPIDF